jgi:glutathione S-transferase
VTIDTTPMALPAAVLFLKMFAISGYQGFHRITKKAFQNPEDARVFGRNEPLPAELPQVQRAALAWRNDLENIPMFLILVLVWLGMGASADAVSIYCWTFVAARVVHTVVFLAGLQPWRTLAYSLGVACTVGVLAQIVKAAG